MRTSSEKPFISLGSPRGIALSSFDIYVEQSKQKKKYSAIPGDFQPNDQIDQISRYQQLQSKLCEELNAERRRSEGLKSTYIRAQSLSNSHTQQKITQIEEFLLLAINKTPAIKRALRYISQLENKNQETQNLPESSELEHQVKEAEITGEKEAKLNKALKKKLQQSKEQIDMLAIQLADAQKNFKEIVTSKKEMKDKLKDFIEKFRKREVSWKERYQALEAELEAQH